MNTVKNTKGDRTHDNASCVLSREHCKQIGVGRLVVADAKEELLMSVKWNVDIGQGAGGRGREDAGDTG